MPRSKPQRECRGIKHGATGGFRQASLYRYVRIFFPVTQALEVKQQGLQDFGTRYDQGEIDQHIYQQEFLNLEVEVLSVPLHWDLSLIQKLISSPEFSDLHAGLVELGEKVQSLERELEASGIARPRKGKTSKISSSASVLTRVTREIARAQGYALVLRKEEALYWTDRS